jgi:hypothetical protein
MTGLKEGLVWTGIPGAGRFKKRLPAYRGLRQENKKVVKTKPVNDFRII